jgi:large subunit ribosomal protein L21
MSSCRTASNGKEWKVFAIVRTGGKQYRVEPGQTISVERLPFEVGQEAKLDDVLLVSDDAGVRVGSPVVEGAQVRATVVAQERGPKIIVFKYKPKKRYRRRSGHRQQLTRLRIDAIET